MDTSPRLRVLLIVGVSLLFGSVGRAQQPAAVTAPADPLVTARAFRDLFPGHISIERPAPPLFGASAGIGEKGTRDETTTSAGKPPRHAFSTLYAGFVGSQALDVHSTIRALDAGHKEANPLARWATTHPVTLVAFKGAATAATVYLIERLRKKHPKRALFLLVALDSAYAIVVAHNYSVPMPRR